MMQSELVQHRQLHKANVTKMLIIVDVVVCLVYSSNKVMSA